MKQFLIEHRKYILSHLSKNDIEQYNQYKNSMINETLEDLKFASIHGRQIWFLYYIDKILKEKYL